MVVDSSNDFLRSAPAARRAYGSEELVLISCLPTLPADERCAPVSLQRWARLFRAFGAGAQVRASAWRLPVNSLGRSCGFAQGSTLTTDNTDDIDLHRSKKFNQNILNLYIRAIRVHPW